MMGEVVLLDGALGVWVVVPIEKVVARCPGVVGVPIPEPVVVVERTPGPQWHPELLMPRERRPEHEQCRTRSCRLIGGPNGLLEIHLLWLRRHRHRVQTNWRYYGRRRSGGRPPRGLVWMTRITTATPITSAGATHRLDGSILETAHDRTDQKATAAR